MYKDLSQSSVNSEENIQLLDPICNVFGYVIQVFKWTGCG